MGFGVPFGRLQPPGMGGGGYAGGGNMGGGNAGPAPGGVATPGVVVNGGTTGVASTMPQQPQARVDPRHQRWLDWRAVHQRSPGTGHPEGFGMRPPMPGGVPQFPGVGPMGPFRL